MKWLPAAMRYTDEASTRQCRHNLQRQREEFQLGVMRAREVIAADPGVLGDMSLEDSMRACDAIEARAGNFYEQRYALANTESWS